MHLCITSKYILSTGELLGLGLGALAGNIFVDSSILHPPSSSFRFDALHLDGSQHFWRCTFSPTAERLGDILFPFSSLHLATLLSRELGGGGTLVDFFGSPPSPWIIAGNLG